MLHSSEVYEAATCSEKIGIIGAGAFGTALGVAFLAGLAVGYWQNMEEISDIWQINRVFLPEIDNICRKVRIQGWEKAVKRAAEWEESSK